ncbi:hypothetical protein BDR26DRAFT_922561 [Obelidium mucronatum]|nr:hypothetical protein BDR26DRAFT_922561 [Obelidium mucronatum]
MNPASLSFSDPPAPMSLGSFGAGQQFLTELLGAGGNFSDFSDFFAMDQTGSPSSLYSAATVSSSGSSASEYDSSNNNSDPFGSFVIPSDCPPALVVPFPVAPLHSIIGDFELGPSSFAFGANTAGTAMPVFAATAQAITTSPSSIATTNNQQHLQRTKPRRRPRADTPKAMKAIAKLVATMDAAEVGGMLTKAEQKKLRAYSRNLQCADCSSTSTPLWRKGPDGRHLCNACGLYFIKYNTSRTLVNNLAATTPSTTDASTSASPVMKEEGWTIQSHLASLASKPVTEVEVKQEDVCSISDTFMGIPATAPVAAAEEDADMSEETLKSDFMASLLYSSEQGFVASSANPVATAVTSSFSTSVTSGYVPAAAAYECFGGDQAVLEDYFWTEMLEDD